MSREFEDFNTIEHDPPVELFAKELQDKRFQTRSNNTQKKDPLKVQVSKPPKNSVKIKPQEIKTHFKWALILTIFCFFVIGPCWALYKTFKLRRMIEQQELKAAEHLSNKIASTLLISTIVGVFLWISFLFCTFGVVAVAKLFTL